MAPVQWHMYWRPSLLNTSTNILNVFTDARLLLLVAVWTVAAARFLHVDSIGLNASSFYPS